MKAITLRNLPSPVARAKEKTSLNQTVIGLLALATGHVAGTGTKTLHHDLDKFAGRWTQREADAFDACLRDMRRVNPKGWK